MAITITIAAPRDTSKMAYITNRTALDIADAVSAYLASINIGHAMMSDGVVTEHIGDGHYATIVIVNTTNKE
jgi:hypothetical protein